MKRPLAVIGITMFSVLFVLCGIGSMLLSLTVLSVSLLGFVLCMIIKKSRQSAFLPTVFGSAAAACLLLFGFEFFFFLPAQSSATEKGEITAVVLETPYESGTGERLYFSAKITSVDGKSVNKKARLSFPNKLWKKNTPMLPQETKQLEAGDRLTFIGKLYCIGEASPEIKSYYKSLNICLGAYPLSSVKVEKKAVKNLFTLLAKERKKAINQILSAFDGDRAGLLISLLTGSKNYVSKELYSSFKAAGSAHIMAVSGLHLSVWISFILDFLRKRNALTKGKIVLLMLFVFLVMFFASFSGSVKRAGVMMLLYLFSKLFGEESDRLNSLGFSAVCVLFQNPYSAVNAGFVLSFLSVLTIILIALPLSNAVFLKIKQKLASKRGAAVIRTLISSVFISFFITLETLPFQIWYFSGFSLVGVLTNLLLLPFAAPAVVLGGLYVMFYFVPLLSKVLFILSGFALMCCEKITVFASSFPLPFATLSKQAVWAATVVSAFSAVLLLRFIKKKKLSDYI